MMIKDKMNTWKSFSHHIFSLKNLMNLINKIQIISWAVNASRILLKDKLYHKISYMINISTHETENRGKWVMG